MSGPDDPFADPLERLVDAPAPLAPAAAPPWLARLNPEQRAAVEALDGPVLVLAGAGTGKTRVLTTRLAHILAARRAAPGQILAVTFTNKAAREMKERIGDLIGGVVEGMQWLGTFHSIGARILRRHAEIAGLKPNFTILDEDDQLRLIKQVIEAAGIDDKRHPPRMFLACIDRWKNRGWGPDDISAGEAHGYAEGRGAALYAEYQARLKTLNAADFGDLLNLNITIFKARPDILAEYQNRFRFILVDEYQDTNVAQHIWLKLLAGERKNVCCVGDDDQSIYGWRGAEVGNILGFERDFPGARIIRLERNYRSTPQILAAASGLIAENKGRLGKTLWTEDGAGEKVIVSSYWDGEEEARTIADEIESLQRKGESLAQMAILVRASFQMREFEDRFIALGIPYRVIGGPRFYERLEIRDALAYLRVVAQPDDGLAFERIVNKPKRGLGEAAVQLIHKAARAGNISLARAARLLADSDEFPTRNRTTLRQLMDNFDRWRDSVPVLPHADLAAIVLEESGYIDMLQNDKSLEAQGRLDNLKELIRSMADFENLAGFLEHVSLVMERVEDDSAERISIMTLHAAKGLEFNTVFLPGWEEGLFPHQRALDEGGREGLEEERRLAYVGLTRARKRAFVSHAANRRMYNQWQAAISSRFISELPPDHIEMRDSGHFGASQAASNRWTSTFASDYSNPGWRRAQNATRDGGFKSRPPMLEASATLIATDTGESSGFRPGDRVVHAKFGNGKVTAAEGSKLTVRFDKDGEKRVIASFLRRA
ncbi:MAG TPA: UvrD-helicase domain-containing protein [Micropepsaceae bacterium]|nr:UvrD-helicase domain-containing protein [Micropepsaceae bacterium]